MKLEFIGDPNDNFSGAYGRDGQEDKTITLCGVTFTKNKAVEVDSKVFSKLKDHSHFKAVKAAPKAKKTKSE